MVSQITASGISDAAALEVAASLLPQLSNRGAGQLPALQTLLPLLQASPVLCSSLLPRLLPPLITLASRPGAPSSLLSATFPCLELLVRHSSSQSESGRQVLHFKNVHVFLHFFYYRWHPQCPHCLRHCCHRSGRAQRVGLHPLLF